MSKEDLIPLKGKDDAHSKRIRAMLKGSSSLKRKESQQLRRLREASSENLEERVLELVSNSETSKIMIARYLVAIMKKNLPVDLQLKLASVLINFYKSMYPQPVLAFQQNIVSGEDTATKIVNLIFEKDKEVKNEN